MIRHISIFIFKQEEKEEHKRLFVARLKAMETELVNVVDYHVAEDCMPRPPKGIQGVPEFGDVVQMIDFVDVQDVYEYPNHPAHVNLMQDMGDYLEKVVAMDVEIV